MGLPLVLLVLSALALTAAACWKRYAPRRKYRHYRCRSTRRQPPAACRHGLAVLDPLAADPVPYRLLGLAVSRFAHGKAFRLTVGRFFFAGVADVRLQLHMVSGCCWVLGGLGLNLRLRCCEQPAAAGLLAADGSAAPVTDHLLPPPPTGPGTGSACGSAGAGALDQGPRQQQWRQ